MIRKICLSLIVLAFVLSPLRADAATKGIGLSPAIQEVTLNDSDKSVSFKVFVINSTDDTAELKLSMLDFGSLDESGGIAFLGRTGQESGSHGLRQWMRLDKETLTLEPGQSDEVGVTIDNKSSLGPGGHYGAVIVSALSSGQQDKDSLSVLPSASTLVLLKKQGGEDPKLQLDSIKANSSLINLPKNTQLRFHNAGNIHLVPRGTVELIGPTGSVLSRGVINESSAYILPESYRLYDVNMSNLKQPWLPGRYKQVITWRYDGTEQTTTTEKHYYYAGKLSLLVVLILCLSIVLIMYIKYRKRPLTSNI